MGKNAKIEEFHLSLWYTIIVMSLTVYTHISHHFSPKSILQKLAGWHLEKNVFVDSI